MTQIWREALLWSVFLSSNAADFIWLIRKYDSVGRNLENNYVFLSNTNQRLWSRVLKKKKRSLKPLMLMAFNHLFPYPWSTLFQHKERSCARHVSEVGVGGGYARVVVWWTQGRWLTDVEASGAGSLGSPCQESARQRPIGFVFSRLSRGRGSQLGRWICTDQGKQEKVAQQVFQTFWRSRTFTAPTCWNDPTKIVSRDYSHFLLFPSASTACCVSRANAECVLNQAENKTFHTHSWTRIFPEPIRPVRFTEMERCGLVFPVGLISVGALPKPPQCSCGSTGRFPRSGSGVPRSPVNAIDGFLNRDHKNVELVCVWMVICTLLNESTNTCEV